MRGWSFVASGLAAAALFWTGAAEADSPWSATLYAGPSSTKFVTQILGGDFEVNGGMAGLALDRGLFKLGSGISLAAEVQATEFFGSYSYGTRRHRAWLPLRRIPLERPPSDDVRDLYRPVLFAQRRDHQGPGCRIRTRNS